MEIHWLIGLSSSEGSISFLNLIFFNVNLPAVKTYILTQIPNNYHCFAIFKAHRVFITHTKLVIQHTSQTEVVSADSL